MAEGGGLEASGVIFGTVVHLWAAWQPSVSTAVCCVHHRAPWPLMLESGGACVCGVGRSMRYSCSVGESPVSPGGGGGWVCSLQSAPTTTV